MQKLFAAIQRALAQGQSVVRLSVISSSGSTPRGAGAVMAVFADGSIFGTIGGGAVENASILAAKDALESGVSEILPFDLTGKDAASLGMVCGGEMTVLLDVLQPHAEHIDLVNTILARYESRRGSILATVWDGSSKVIHRGLWPLDGALLSRLPKIALPERFRTPFVRSFEGGALFLEPLPVAETVHFIGAGHVARATARLAASTGFRVSVTDDRAEFANADQYPQAHAIHVADSLGDCLPEALGPEDYVVIMTRGHLHDREVLAKALHTGAGYVGMIGSRKKRETVFASLLAEGFTQHDLNRVHCPIGLPIGADTPDEIAVSIIAELIDFRANHSPNAG